MDMAKVTYLYGKRGRLYGKSDLSVAKDTYSYGKRDLYEAKETYMWQKRPIEGGFAGQCWDTWTFCTGVCVECVLLL